jgi:hypothetical protein
MTEWRRPSLGLFWTSRRAGAWLFVTLLLVAGGERRVADVAYTLHLFTDSDVGVYDETVAGDEVTLRLMAMADASAPLVVAPASPLLAVCTSALPERTGRCSIDAPAPRGPPAASSAIA